MREVAVFGSRIRSIKENDNADIVIGRPTHGDYVTSVMIQNIGKNSLAKLLIDGKEILLRPGQEPLSMGVNWPACFEANFRFIFEQENQQPIDNTGSQPPLDPNQTDITQPDVIFHNIIMVETYFKRWQELQ